MPADTGRVAVYQYRTGKMPMCKTVDHCYEGGSKTVVDRYHAGNNLGTGPALFQYYNVYWVATNHIIYIMCSLHMHHFLISHTNYHIDIEIKCTYRSQEQSHTGSNVHIEIT